jgi:hypothetical protein
MDWCRRKNKDYPLECSSQSEHSTYSDFGMSTAFYRRSLYQDEK